MEVELSELDRRPLNDLYRKQGLKLLILQMCFSRVDYIS